MNGWGGHPISKELFPPLRLFVTHQQGAPNTWVEQIGLVWEAVEHTSQNNSTSDGEESHSVTDMRMKPARAGQPWLKHEHSFHAPETKQFYHHCCHVGEKTNIIRCLHLHIETFSTEGDMWTKLHHRSPSHDLTTQTETTNRTFTKLP